MQPLLSSCRLEPRVLNISVKEVGIHASAREEWSKSFLGHVHTNKIAHCFADARGWALVFKGDSGPDRAQAKCRSFFLTLTSPSVKTEQEYNERLKSYLN